MSSENEKKSGPFVPGFKVKLKGRGEDDRTALYLVTTADKSGLTCHWKTSDEREPVIFDDNFRVLNECWPITGKFMGGRSPEVEVHLTSTQANLWRLVRVGRDDEFKIVTDGVVGGSVDLFVGNDEHEGFRQCISLLGEDNPKYVAVVTLERVALSELSSSG
jgi:hypothetical protein